MNIFIEITSAHILYIQLLKRNSTESADNTV